MYRKYYFQRILRSKKKRSNSTQCLQGSSGESVNIHISAGFTREVLFLSKFYKTVYWDLVRQKKGTYSTIKSSLLRNLTLTTCYNIYKLVDCRPIMEIQVRSIKILIQVIALVFFTLQMVSAVLQYLEKQTISSPDTNTLSFLEKPMLVAVCKTSQINFTQVNSLGIT